MDNEMTNEEKKLIVQNIILDIDEYYDDIYKNDILGYEYIKNITFEVYALFIEIAKILDNDKFINILTSYEILDKVKYYLVMYGYFDDFDAEFIGTYIGIKPQEKKEEQKKSHKIRAEIKSALEVLKKYSTEEYMCMLKHNCLELFINPIGEKNDKYNNFDLVEKERHFYKYTQQGAIGEHTKRYYNLIRNESGAPHNDINLLLSFVNQYRETSFLNNLS